MKLLLIIWFSFFAIGAHAQDSTAAGQQTDTSHRRITTLHKKKPAHRTDSVQKRIDSLRRDSVIRDSLFLLRDSLVIDSSQSFRPSRKDSLHPDLQLPFTSDSFLFQKQLFFSFTNPVRYTITEKRWEGKEVLFYSVVGLLILFALIKNSSYRYLSDLFSIYFRTTIRQRQIKEQLLQNPLPSLLFNLFFVVSGGVFCSLLLQHFGLGTQFPLWMLAAYCAVGLSVIYAGKYVSLKFLGWVFQAPQAIDTYIFVVFATNKILGILLLPFTILLAFTNGPVNGAAVTLSIIITTGFFLYQYFLSYVSIYRFMHISVFNLLLYLAAFEVLPLLLINKLLFLFLNGIL